MADVTRRRWHALASVFAIVGWLAPSIAQARVEVDAQWCHQRVLKWDTARRSPAAQPYVVTLTGNPGLRADGSIAWLGYFISNAGGQGVYFVPAVSASPARVLLPVLNLITSTDPHQPIGELTLAADLILANPPNSDGVIGTLEFEIDDVVTQTVPLLWQTNSWNGKAIMPPPQWDPLAPPPTAPTGPRQPQQMFMFNLEFTGCPPITMVAFERWASRGSASPGATFSVPFTAAINSPGLVSVWVADVDLYRNPNPAALRSLPDSLHFATPARDAAGAYVRSDVRFPIRRELQLTSGPLPSRIDLGLRRCWYPIEVRYTGGYPIQQVSAGTEQGATTRSVKWQTQRLRRGAILKIEVPAQLALESSFRTPSRIWFTITQPSSAPQFRVAVVNAPTPPTPALPPGGCD